MRDVWITGRTVRKCVISWWILEFLNGYLFQYGPDKHQTRECSFAQCLLLACSMRLGSRARVKNIDEKKKTNKQNNNNNKTRDPSLASFFPLVFPAYD